jgi:hypothetical protein
MNLA